MVTTKKAIKPVTASLSGSSYDGTEMIDYLSRNQEKLVVVDGEKICAACGSAKVLNIALLPAPQGLWESQGKAFKRPLRAGCPKNS